MLTCNTYVYTGNTRECTCGETCSSDRLNIYYFFYRKQFIQLKPIRAMIPELSERIWGRLGLSSVRAVPLEEPRAPSAEAAVTELRPHGAAWTRKLRLRPLPGQQVFTIDAMRLLVDQLRDLLAIRLPFLAKVSFQAGRPLPYLETPNSARQHDPAGGAGAQGRHSLQGVPRDLRP